MLRSLVPLFAIVMLLSLYPVIGKTFCCVIILCEPHLTISNSTIYIEVRH